MNFTIQRSCRALAVLLSGLLAIAFLGIRAQANPQFSPPISSHDLPNFLAVENSIYRGGRPTDIGIEDLKRLGVRTIVNLENDDEAIAHENIVAQKYGIKMYSLVINPLLWPNDRRVNEALLLLENPADHPIYVHCQHGQDRTGMIIGLYRVEYDHWQPKVAYGEMLKLGFHRLLFMLDWYFRKRTGM